MTEYKIVKWKNYGFINPKLDPDSGIALTLDEYLQYERQGKQFMANPQWATVHLYSRKKSMFPWGLLKTVKKVMDKYCTIHQHIYTIEYTPEICEMENIPDLRPYQLEAVAALLKHNGGILCLPTGSGKTITLIKYLKLMNLKSLVIVGTIDIRKQWQDHGLENVTVSTYQNPKLKNEMEQYEIIVFDECHHVSAKSLYTLAMKVKTTAILIGCSATTKREDGEDMRITAALGEVVYEKSRRELIIEGWIANAKVFYLRPTFTADGEYTDYQEVYLTQIVHNAHRNKLVKDAALKEAALGRKILILVSYIEHGEILYELINGPYKTIFMNGKSKDRDQDMSVYDIIIATPIYDEGYNLPSLDCLILAAGGKSEIRVIQRVGRILRPKPDGRLAHIYDFQDSIKYIKGHYLKRRRLLEEEFEVVDDQDTLVGG